MHRPTRPDIFVSYTSKDQAWAKWIAWQLERAGKTVRIQAWDFAVGSSFIEQMQLALIECDRLLAVYSPEYFESPYGQEELLTALQQTIATGVSKVLPVKVRPCNPPGMLAHRVYIDLTHTESEAEAQELLLASLDPPGRRPTIPPPFPGGPARETSGIAPYPGVRKSVSEPDLSKHLRSFAGKYDMPGGYWRDLSRMAESTFVLVGRTNKSWISRSSAQRQQFAVDLSRIAIGGGRVDLITDESPESIAAMQTFLLREVAPKLEHLTEEDKLQAVKRIRLLVAKEVRYQAVWSDTKIVVLPLLNSASFREEAIVIELCELLQKDQFTTYSEDIDRLVGESRQVDWQSTSSGK